MRKILIIPAFLLLTAVPVQKAAAQSRLSESASRLLDECRTRFSQGDYNKQTGIDKVVYDTGKEHVNTLEDFRYNKPLESLSVNLPLGSTVNAVAYKNYERIGDADVFVAIDSENPDRSYTDYYWPY